VSNPTRQNLVPEMVKVTHTPMQLFVLKPRPPRHRRGEEKKLMPSRASLQCHTPLMSTREATPDRVPSWSSSAPVMEVSGKLGVETRLS